MKQDPRAVQGTGNAAHGTGSAAPSNKEAGPGHAKGTEPAPRLRRCTSARRVLSGGPTLRQKIQGYYRAARSVSGESRGEQQRPEPGRGAELLL